MNYPEQKKKLNDLQELLFQMELTELNIVYAMTRFELMKELYGDFDSDDVETYQNTLKRLQTNYDKIKASL